MIITYNIEEGYFGGHASNELLHSEYNNEWDELKRSVVIRDRFCHKLLLALPFHLAGTI